jgi:hypothetical protein
MTDISSETLAADNTAAARLLSGSGSPVEIVVAVSRDSTTSRTAARALAFAWRLCRCRTRRSSWSTWRYRRFTSAREAMLSQLANGRTTWTAAPSTSANKRLRCSPASLMRRPPRCRSRSAKLLNCDTRLRTTRPGTGGIRSRRSVQDRSPAVAVFSLASDAGRRLPVCWSRPTLLAMPTPPCGTEEMHLTLSNALPLSRRARRAQYVHGALLKKEPTHNAAAYHPRRNCRQPAFTRSAERVKRKTLNCKTPSDEPV